VRIVALPAMRVDAMKRHLAEFPAEDEELIFCGPLVPHCVATTFIDRFAGHKRRAGGSTHRIHFHDLRHTGNNLAAASGASTRELMHRMGHGSMRAALATGDLVWSG
jgi:integrase